MKKTLYLEKSFHQSGEIPNSDHLINLPICERQLHLAFLCFICVLDYYSVYGNEELIFAHST